MSIFSRFFRRGGKPKDHYIRQSETVARIIGLQRAADLQRARADKAEARAAELEADLERYRKSNRHLRAMLHGSAS